MKSRRSPETHNQFVSGWVGVVKFMQTEENIYLLTATVLYSQALSDDPLQSWVALQKCGSVICAHCNCMTGWVQFTVCIFLIPNNVFVYCFVTGQVHHEGNIVVSLCYIPSGRDIYLFKNVNNTLYGKSLRPLFSICFCLNFWKGKHTLYRAI